MIFNQIDRNNNMNAVRYYLCLCILMNHFNVLTGASLPALPRIFGGVGSFFAISGFLMFASFEKRPVLKSYLDRRARRILPPYVFIVVLSAVCLSMVSVLPAWEYFTDIGFLKYLLANLSFLNFLEPSLPGVFTEQTNLVSAVNGALWTMKCEVVCYISVPLVFAVIRRYASRVSLVLIALIVICLAAYVVLTHLAGEGENGLMAILARQFKVFTFFYIGALINVHVALIKKYKWLILGSVLIVLYISSFGLDARLCLRPFSDSVLVIWCSLIGSWGRFLSRYNSLSYDIYLFHFPIIQTLLSLGIVSGVGLWASLWLTIALSVALASFSWLCIGRPILNRRPVLMARRFAL